MSARSSCTPEQVDEAAVWMTLLHGPDRDERTECGFRRWLSDNPAHAAAFEKISTAFEATAAWPRGPFPRASRWQRMGFRAGFVGATSVVAVAAALALVGLFLYFHNAGVRTGIGEQRMLALEDGSRLFLNTDTRVVINYDSQQRTIELKKGEVMFEVARRPQWPFVVMAGGRRITALGTAFVVRRENQRVSVTLVEGRVAVAPATHKPALLDQGTTLLPGQRLIFAGASPPRLDHPQLEKLTAWRQGHVDFDEVPLADAIAEMNRYSTVTLSVDRPEAARLPITGVFRAGATPSFAAAVADAYRLKIIERSDEIVLAGVPSAPAGKSN